MQKKQFEKNWPQLKNEIQNEWSKLTTDDINQIDGMFDQCVNQLVKRYGYSRDTALREIENWEPDLENPQEQGSAQAFEPHVHKDRASQTPQWKSGQQSHQKPHPSHAAEHEKKRKVS